MEKKATTDGEAVQGGKWPDKKAVIFVLVEHKVGVDSACFILLASRGCLPEQLHGPRVFASSGGQAAHKCI